MQSAEQNDEGSSGTWKSWGEVWVECLELSGREFLELVSEVWCREQEQRFSKFVRLVRTMMV